MSLCAYIVLSCHGLDVAAHLEAQGRVQATRRFIEEQDLGVGDEATGDTETFLLSTAQTFLDRSANNCIRLSLQPKALYQVVHASACFGTSDVSARVSVSVILNECV